MKITILFILSLTAVTALADVTGTTTLTPGTAFSFDSGAVVTSGADVLWSGTSFTPQGKAIAFAVPGAGGAAFYAQVTQALLQQFASFGSSAPITSVSLPSGTVVGYKTNGGNFGKALVTANTGTTLSLQYLTYGANATGPGGPNITGIANNYGLVAQGQPNYGIAPGALFFITGSALANTTTSLQSSATPGLQTTLQGVTVTASVGGTSIDCPLYYLSPTQIDAVLPGKMPAGTGTIIVNNNGTKSATATLVVVQSAFGILNYNGTLAATYDAGNAIITSNNAANPGQTIVVWGSGVGYDPADDDKVFPQGQNNLTNSVSLKAYVGGLQAAVAYAGRSQYPGVDQIVLTIPNGVAVGCWVSLAIVSGNPPIVSNGTTIPIAASGRTCSEPNSIFSPSLIQSFAGKTTVRTGGLVMGQTTGIGAGNGTGVQNFIGGTFQSVATTAYSNTNGGNQVSTGSCLVNNSAFSTTLTNTTPLDAGPSINVTGPQSSLTLTKLSAFGQQVYTVTSVPTNFIPASGGPFTYDNGGGGADVGHFNTTTNFPANFTWTNPSVVTVVERTQGVTVTWSGGAPGVTVTINGTSSATVNGQTVSGSFTCQAPLSAGTFTVPVPALLALPAGAGTLSLTDDTNPQTFTATGLDIGYTFDTVGFSENVRYN